MSPTLLLLTLLACDDGAHLRPGGSSDDTGELPDAGAFAVACELDPVPGTNLHSAVRNVHGDPHHRTPAMPAAV